MGYVRKPLLSRQGSNIEIVQEGLALSLSVGPYGEEGHVLQALHRLPEFAGKFPLVGCWMVAGQPAGLSIRESQTLVTDGDANFIPHIILD